MYNNPQPSPQAKGSNIQVRKCYEYNNRGRCTHPYCRYSHSCLKCEGRHPAVNCRVPNTRFGQFNPVYNAINGKRDQNSIKRAGQWANKQLSRQWLQTLRKTTVKLDKLKTLSISYPNKTDAKILSDGFEFGFKVNYKGPRLAVNCKNLKSAYQFETENEEKIKKKRNRIR